MLVVSSLREVAECIVISSDDFLACGIAAYVLIAHAESDHVYSHVGRGLVWTFSIYALEKRVEHREYLDVPIIACSHLVVCLEMERVDHVDVVQVSCRSLIGYVHRMLEREVPYRECLELCISGLDAALVLMVELAKADCHLSAARTWRCDHYERPAGLYIVVLSESLVRVDQSHVVRVALDGIMVVYLDSKALKALAVSICT